ncbi:MAG TPA: inositol monophosphatase family protein [Candidatus Limnocylindrales bacterium]|nr:inositol monophosphatase family protein [Candidatus Limnocylindrales bacterium]
MKATKKAPNSEINLREAQRQAVGAARVVGELMRRNLAAKKRANTVTQHDIKLELDVRSQKLIEKKLRAAFPQTALLGEEGVAGNSDSAYRWVVDPIDGTVNFAYGIPHACVSIALQRENPKAGTETYADGYATLLGVVYDPFADELWTALRGQPARLNGRIIRVSKRRNLQEAIVSIGFAKSRETLEATLPYFLELVHQVRKIRIMGAAALALTYVATGRFDAYIERGIRLWDIAAGGLILQSAGGDFWQQPAGPDHTYRMIASNGLLRRQLRVPD